MPSREADQFLRRLQKDPDDGAAFLALRNIYEAANDHLSLASLLEQRAERIIMHDPASAADLFYRASEAWLDRLGDVKRGGGALVRSLEADPLHRSAGMRLEQLYREAGDYRSLVNTLERRVQALAGRDSTSGAAARHIAAIHHQLGEIWETHFQRADRAIFHYRKAFETDASCVAAYYAAREIYRNAGNFKAAAVLYDLEANAEPDPGRKVALYRELAHMRTERLGDIEGAVVALKRAAAIAPSDVAVMQELAVTLLRRAEADGNDQDKRRAADLLYQIAQMVDSIYSVGYAEAALDAAPDHEGALGLLTEQLGLSGQTDVLRERYRTFLDAAPDSPHAAEVRRWLGRIAMEQGPIEEAIKCFEALRAQGDEEAPGILADLYRRTGRPQDLAKSLAASVDTLGGTERVPRLRELAQVHLSLGEMDQAAARMAQILQVDPGDPEAFSFLEDHYRDRGDWARLKDLLVAAVRVPGASLASRVLRLRTVASICEDQLGDPEGAALAWRGIAAIDPSDGEARASLQRLLAAAGKWEDLVKVLEKEALATVDLGAKIAVYRRLAEVHASKRRDAGAACAALHRILELQPNDQPAILALDDAYEAAGRFAELAKLLRRRIDDASETAIRVELRKRLAWVLDERLGDHEAAFQVCLQALDELPDDPQVLARMEAIDERIGRWERLIETLAYRTEVTVSSSGRADIYGKMGMIAEGKLGDDKRAVEFLSQALELRPSDKAAIAGLERLLGKQGRWRELAKVLNRLRDLERDSTAAVEINRRLGRLLTDRLGEPDEAIEAWERVLEVGEDPEALDSLARHALAAERWADLVGYLERLAPLAPDLPRKRAILLRRAQVLASELAREDDAVLVLEKILADTDPACLDAVRMLRGIHEQRANHAKAAETMEREVLLLPDPDEALALLVRLAQIYEDELGDTERAMSAHERIRELDPDHDGAIAALERLYQAAERWDKLVLVLRDVADGPMEELARVRLLARMSEICEKKLGDEARAWDLVRESFQTSPEIDEALEDVRKSAARLGRQPELAAVLAEAAQKAQTPGAQARWWREAAIVYEVGMKDARRALEATLRAFATDPTDISYLDEVDRLAPKSEAWERVTSVYEALGRRMQEPRDRLRLLRRHAELEANVHGDRNAAMDLELKALEIAPEDAEVLGAIEEHARASERFADLVLVYDKLLGLTEDASERIGWLLKMAKVFQENISDPQRAFEVLRQALLLDPFDEVHADEVGRRVKEIDAASPEKGRYLAELVTIVRDLAAQRAEQPQMRSKLLRRIARIHADHLEDRLGAFEALKDAMEATPTDEGAYQAIEGVASDLGIWEALADHYSRLLADAVDPEAARIIHGRRARLLEEELDRPAEAAEHYWRLWELGPGQDQPQEKLKAIFRASGAYNDLLLVFERELGSLGADDDPARRRALLREVAHVWEQGLGNLYEAVEAYERLLGDDPADEEAFDALERLYRSQSRWDDVAGLLTTARQDASAAKRGAALARAAVVLAEKLRRWKEAQTTLARASELAPEATDTIEARARVEAALAAKDDLSSVLDLEGGAELAPKFDISTSSVGPLPEAPTGTARTDGAGAETSKDVLATTLVGAADMDGGGTVVAAVPAEDDEVEAAEISQSALLPAEDDDRAAESSQSALLPAEDSERSRIHSDGASWGSGGGRRSPPVDDDSYRSRIQPDGASEPRDLTLPARSPFVPEDDDGRADGAAAPSGGSRASRADSLPPFGPTETWKAPERVTVDLALGAAATADSSEGQPSAEPSPSETDRDPLTQAKRSPTMETVELRAPLMSSIAFPRELEEGSRPVDATPTVDAMPPPASSSERSRIHSDGAAIVEEEDDSGAEPLVIETMSLPKPSADTTGELDVEDVLEAVELVDEEPPPPPPPPVAKGKKGKKAAPPPTPAGASKRRPNPPPPPIPLTPTRRK